MGADAVDIAKHRTPLARAGRVLKLQLPGETSPGAAYVLGLGGVLFVALGVARHAVSSTGWGVLLWVAALWAWRRSRTAEVVLGLQNATIAFAGRQAGAQLDAVRPNGTWVDDTGRSFRLPSMILDVDVSAFLFLRNQLWRHGATVEQRLVLEVLELSGLTRAFRGRRARCIGVAVTPGPVPELLGICETRHDVARLREAKGNLTLYGVRARDQSGKGASWSTHTSEVVMLDDSELPTEPPEILP